MYPALEKRDMEYVNSEIFNSLTDRYAKTVY